MGEEEPVSDAGQEKTVSKMRRFTGPELHTPKPSRARKRGVSYDPPDRL